MKNKREFCISIVRKVLNSKHIKYEEIEAKSGSIYFRLYLDTSAPCLRLSDHHYGKKKPSVSIIWNVGDNAKEKNIKHRIEITINKMIKNSRIGTTMGILNQLKNNIQI